MRLNRERQGELFIFSEALLWSLFPVITILSFVSVSPMISLAWSTFFAVLFFILVVAGKRSWRDLKKTAAYGDIFWGAFILGICYYVLVFWGAQYTSAGNIALILPTEIFFTYVFFRHGRKDPLSRQHTMGAFLMLLAAGIVLYPTVGQFHRGDFLIILASAIAPVGNFFQQRARAHVGGEIILLVRGIVATVVIFALASIADPKGIGIALENSWMFLFINGFFLFGFSKLLWIEGIHRISVPKAIALSNISPVLTLLFAWFILHDAPTVWQLSALVPIFFGIRLLQTNGKNVSEE